MEGPACQDRAEGSGRPLDCKIYPGEASRGWQPAPVDLAISAFGYMNHAFRLIRQWTATHAAANDRARLEEVLDRSNTASDMWANTAYRSAKTECSIFR
jgi:hypothetical protein